MKYRIAVASTDGKVVNRHFGKAEWFYIVEADSEDRGHYEFTDLKKVQPFCEGGLHKEEQLSGVMNTLSDCDFVLVSRVGPRAAAEAEAKGVRVVELPGLISESVEELMNYQEIRNLIEELRS